MEELRELYQELILDHNSHPRNWGKIDFPSHTAEGYNPLCGDHYHIYIKLEGGVIREIKFEGSGCAISKSSASLMTEAVKNKTVAEVNKLFGSVHQLLAEKEMPDVKPLGKLAVFAGVRDYPARVKCASLAWHTLKTAVEGGGTAKTE